MGGISAIEYIAFLTAESLDVARDSIAATRLFFEGFVLVTESRRDIVGCLEATLSFSKISEGFLHFSRPGFIRSLYFQIFGLDIVRKDLNLLLKASDHLLVFGAPRRDLNLGFKVRDSLL